MGTRSHPLYERWYKLKRRKLLCDEWQSFDNFISDLPTINGRMSRLDTSRLYSLDNLKIYEKTSESLLERKRRTLKEFHARNPNKHREYKLKGLYTITQQDYDTMLHSQKFVCKICGRPERVKVNGKTKVLAVDHCHTTGAIRGLLCQACNKAIGLFEDRQDLLHNAINYLQEN